MGKIQKVKVDIDANVKLTLWSAIKLRIAGIKDPTKEK